MWESYEDFLINVVEDHWWVHWQLLKLVDILVHSDLKKKVIGELVFFILDRANCVQYNCGKAAGTKGSCQ